MSKQQGRKYSGDLFGRLAGTNNVMLPLGNVTELTTSKDVDKDDLPSTGRNDWGEALSSDTQPGATQVSIKFNTFDKFAIARALMGESVDFGGTAENLTAVKFNFQKGGWIDLPHEDLDPAGFVVKDGTTTIEATKYKLNVRLGMIKFNDDVSIADNKELNYTGKTLGRAGFQVDANTLQNLPLELKLDGKERISGKDGILWMPHAVLVSDGDINWMTDDWWSNGLSGTLIKEEAKPTIRFKEFD